jgi:Asp-tRNA(Asn)/Glu-tRNA(Gln) amidotransferase A subunit family amidase
LPVASWSTAQHTAPNDTISPLTLGGLGPGLGHPAFTGPDGPPIGMQVIAAGGADRQLFETARWVHRHIS